MKPYFVSLCSALKLLLAAALLVLVSDLPSPKWRAFTAGVMGYAAIPQPMGNV
jgi:hypothetical protein